MNALVQCTGLTKIYSTVPALDNVDLTLQPGRIIGLLGPNGSGKTTLIKLLNGLLQLTAGSVAIAGMAPGPETKTLVSYLPDRDYFADWMKIADMMDLFADFYADFDREKALRMCQALQLKPSARIKNLSKGTREKMQLMLVMSRRAKLYLLDEPIAGVDPAARDFILRTILTNYNEEGTVLISVNKKDQADVVEVAKSLYEDGFKLVATGGTCDVINAAGIPATKVKKLSEGRPHVGDMITNGDIQLIVNSPIGKAGISDDSYLRKAAIKAKVPYITTIAGAKATAEGIHYVKHNKDGVLKSLQELHSEIHDK